MNKILLVSNKHYSFLQDDECNKRLIKLLEQSARTHILTNNLIAIECGTENVVYKIKLNKYEKIISSDFIVASSGKKPLNNEQADYIINNLELYICQI